MKSSPWDSPDVNKLLFRNVGPAFGPDPASRVIEIRSARIAIGQQICRRLNLNEHDSVLDFGSGLGFVAHAVAPNVSKLFCADISADFLEHCRQELNMWSGKVETILLAHGDFRSLHGRGINKIYSSAVFMHFNIYDLYLSLRAFFSLLPSRGRVWFDYKDADVLRIEDPSFQRHCEFYRTRSHTLPTLLNYFSAHVVDRISRQLGFHVERHQYGEVLLVKP